jgi:hypothetical protein
MDYDTKQQPPKKTKKDRVTRVVDNCEYHFFHGRNYSNCLEYVKDYASDKKLTITFVEVKNEEVPEPLFEAEGLDWQIWRKNYGVVLKHYWINHLLDKKVRVWDNTQDAPEGFTRLYRAVPEKDLPQDKKPKKAKSFVKKAMPTLKAAAGSLSND